MRVGFAVQINEGLESIICDHFGSAPAFIIVDTELNQIATVDNSNADRVHGACSPVAALGRNRVDALVVGGIGAWAWSLPERVTGRIAKPFKEAAAKRKAA